MDATKLGTFFICLAVWFFLVAAYTKREEFFDFCRDLWYEERGVFFAALAFIFAIFGGVLLVN